MITFKDYLEHNHPEVLDEAWWHGALAGLGLMTGFAGGPSAQAASSGSPITTTIRNYKGDKEAPVILSQKFDKIYNAMIESETKSDLKYLYRLFIDINRSKWTKK